MRIRRRPRASPSPPLPPASRRRLLPRGPVRARQVSLTGTPPLRHGTQHDVRPDRHAQIDDEDAEVAPPQAGVRAGGVVGAKYLPHRPRLTADFGGNPAEFDRKNCQWTCNHRKPKEPAVVQQIDTAPTE